MRGACSIFRRARSLSSISIGGFGRSTGLLRIFVELNKGLSVSRNAKSVSQRTKTSALRRNISGNRASLLQYFPSRKGEICCISTPNLLTSVRATSDADGVQYARMHEG